MERDRPHTSERTLFWWYILKNYLQDLMWRLGDLMWRRSILIKPAANERIVKRATAVVLIYQVEKQLEPRFAVPYNPMSLAMRERGAVTRRISRLLVDALAADEENGPTSRVDPHEEVEADEVPGITPPKNARTSSLRKIQEANGDDTCSQVSPYDIFESDAFEWGGLGRPRRQ